MICLQSYCFWCFIYRMFDEGDNDDDDDDDSNDNNNEDDDD